MRVVGISLFLIFCVFYSCNRTIPPKKFDSLPKESFWAGGIDDGHWFNINKFNDSIVNLSIYHDYNGELMSTGNYKLCDECNNVRLDFKDLDKKIIYWAGDEIILNFTNSKTSRYCGLKEVRYIFEEK